jgi:hypothetical protein
MLEQFYKELLMDTESSIGTAYLVALTDPALPGTTRMQAELHYCRELERRLGTPDDVAHALRAVARIAQSEGEPSAEAQTLLVQWQLANHAARQQALQSLPPGVGARFDVRLADA